MQSNALTRRSSGPAQRRVAMHGAVLLAAALLQACGGGGSGGGDDGGGSDLTVGEAVVRDSSGAAIHLDETITTTGVATVSAGVFANNKLKIFVQSEGAGIMVYHQSSADVAAFQAGDELRVTGIVRQTDPTSDNNPATGTVQLDVTDGSAEVLSSGNPLPEPREVSLSQIDDATVGVLVLVRGVSKTSGEWPEVGSRSSQVTVSDDGGATDLVLRFQRNTITPELVARLESIGDGPFDLEAIVVQDDQDDDGSLLGGFELWVRGAEDLAP